MSYLNIARRVRKEGGIEKNLHTLIDQAIRKINKEWEAGALEWIKLNRPDDWGKVLTLERGINNKAIGGDIEGLREALSEYHGLILAMVREFRPLEEATEQGSFNFVERPK